MSSLLEESYEPPLLTKRDGPPPAPVQTWQLRREVVGIETELLIQSFDDRILVIVTQSGKIGCLVQASIPQVAQLPHPPRPESPSDFASSSRITLPPPPDSISTTPLLGTPPSPTLYALYTNQIATLIWWTLQEVGSIRRPVVVGLALTRSRRSDDDGDEDGDYIDGSERDRFLGIMEMVTGWPGNVVNDE